ncbi:MAG TPA: CehA/McbA family metallohydrolase [Acidobacteriaceae bacterium]|nr:CehA/McbA family metallohydrolase [Acidobacteriaceae bacterium]
MKLRWIGITLFLSLALSCICRLSYADSVKPDLVLQGTITHAQNQTYVQVPFNIPPGVFRLTVTFQYTGKEQGTRLDLGIFDPDRFRGASGGNKSSFTISETDATPSYLPGPIIAGRWFLLIAVPNIRPNVVAHYTADIVFETKPQIESFSDGPLRDGPAWYRGDLHMHTGHSDGTCPSQTGKSVPCPVFVTAEAAMRRGLDFIAITDHNTVSQYDAIRELQPYFDTLLFIPGREITTFWGHANAFGITRFVNYRVGSPGVPNINAVARQINRLGGIISINHPNDPTGEDCLGCGWTPNPPADLHLFSAIEAVNGGALRGPNSGVSFWERQLDDGYRIPAIGGSDNHHPAWPLDHADSVGIPTTVVYAQNLSVQAILDGIRAGHVFIDLTGSRNRMLEMTASAPGQATAVMGDAVHAASGADLQLTVHIVGCSGWILKISDNDHGDSAISPQPVSQQDAILHFTWRSDGKRHWLLPQVETHQGKLEVLGNPIYVNYSGKNDETVRATNGK